MSVTGFGTNERRVEGRLKVTGTAHYTNDLSRPGMLWAGFAACPYPAARIVSVDVTAARALPGVHAVLTGADIGPARFGRNLLDWPVLATDVARFAGDRVVAVAAETPDLVARALELVEIDYEPLPAVLDPDSALRPDAPVLHPDAASYTLLRGTRPAGLHPNVQGQQVVARGGEDIEAELARADVVVESHYTTAREHHAFLEPHAALVWIAEDGSVHVTSTNKSPFALREQMAATLGLRPETIVVDNAYIGGDFGGKGLSILEFALYYLARETRRPVTGVFSYAEEFTATNTRHSASMRLRTGVNSDGTFVAHAAELIFDGGAYAAAKPMPGQILPDGIATMAAYAVPHVRVQTCVVYTNTVPGGHMRSPGEVQAIFAGESHVDEIAARLGMDPAELRRRNVVRAGGTNAVGETFTDPHGAEVLDAAARAIGAATPRPAHRGVGLALSQRGAAGGRGGVLLRALPDGDVELITASVDQGTGLYTALARIVADVLEIDPQRVRTEQASTRDALFYSGTGGSRGTRVLGQAARRAALDLRDRLAEAGSARPVEVRAEYETTGEDEEASFIAAAVEVEVDEQTGRVRVLDSVLAAEVGEIINPVAHRGQLEGGFAFGLGAALTEQIPMADGQVLVGSFGDYKIPTIGDMPPLRIIEVRAASGPGPYGAKAVGELSNSVVAPAVANAVAAACGVRVSALPITAESVLDALDHSR